MVNLKNTKFIFFKLPKKNKILLYDYFNNSYQKIVFKETDLPFVFNWSNRYFYFLFIIQIFFSIKAIKILINENLISAYTYNFIKYVNPKIFFTTTDNNLNFYRLKKYFKNIKFVSTQNGSRHKINDIFGEEKIKTFSRKCKHADVIFTFNHAISKFYEKYFNCKTIPIGKFYNNEFKIINQNILKKKLLYISQYRPKHFTNDYFVSHNKKICSTKKWTEVDRKLLPILRNFCNKNNFEIVILGAGQNDYHKNFEKKYYGLYLNNCKWSYWNPKLEQKKRYEHISRFEHIVCSWSTLGVELFSRNFKVAFFRQQNIAPYNDRNFGWPYKMPFRGFWYTNIINEVEVNRVLKNLVKINKKDWISKINYFKRNIMIFDKNNKILKKTISQFINNN